MGCKAVGGGRHGLLWSAKPWDEAEMGCRWLGPPLRQPDAARGRQTRGQRPPEATHLLLPSPNLEVAGHHPASCKGVPAARWVDGHHGNCLVPATNACNQASQHKVLHKCLLDLISPHQLSCGQLCRAQGDGRLLRMHLVGFNNIGVELKWDETILRFNTIE